MVLTLLLILLLILLCGSFARAKTLLQEKTELPREFNQISLLMSVKKVKEKLTKLNIRISEERTGSHPTIGLPYHHLVINNPTREFSAFMYSFYEGKLNSIRVEYNMQNKAVNYDQFISKLKEKYGEPDEVSDESGTLFNVKATVYRWRDKATEMHVGYSPPGEVPVLGTPHLGALDWTILDRNLAEKLHEENERATREFMERREKERLEKNKR